MDIMRLTGLFALIPMTMLLAVSFFVLFAIRKAESQGLKAFGYVVSGLLWLAALIVFSMGIYVLATGRHPAMVMMQKMMGCHKPPMMMMGQEMQGIMPAKK